MTKELVPAKVRLSDQLGPASVARCMCGEMLLSACPGEWEPGCDLGNNPAHVRPAHSCQSTTPELHRPDHQCPDKTCGFLGQ